MHNSKTTQFMWVLHIPNNCSDNADHFYWFRAVCELRLFSYRLKTVSRPQRCLVQMFLWLLTIITRIPGVVNIVRPHLDYWMCALQAVKSLLCYRLPRVCYTCYTKCYSVNIIRRCLQCDSILRGEYESVIPPVFGREYLWNRSNHLDGCSVCKQLVASSACMAEVRKVLVSSTKVITSRLQRETCLSQAPKSVRLKYKTSLSAVWYCIRRWVADHLVTSDKWVRLQFVICSLSFGHCYRTSVH